MVKKLFILILMLALFSCSTRNENEIIESAQKNIEQKNYDEALKDFDQLLSDFPKGENNGIAHLEMAKLYQGNVISGLSKEESMEKAIAHYTTVYEDYPNMTGAPGALFMIGFLQANELNRIDEAKKTYELFLGKYPDHELAASAQTELENLGLSPEEILEKTTAKSE